MLTGDPSFNLLCYDALSFDEIKGRIGGFGCVDLLLGVIGKFRNES